MGTRHPSTRAERRAVNARHVPVWARRDGTRYHAAGDASYTLGDRVAADAPACRMCDIRPMMLGDDRCAECVADARRRNAPRAS